jgi:hypothetical protein
MLSKCSIPQKCVHSIGENVYQPRGGRHAHIHVHRGTDRLRLTSGRIRHAGARGLPETGSERADLLALEAHVRGHGSGQAAAVEATRGGKSAPQAARRRADAGSAHGAGGHPKKAVKPAQQKPLVDFVRGGFAVSEGVGGVPVE